MIRGVKRRKLFIGSGAAIFLLALLTSALLVNHYVWAVDATGLTLSVVTDDKADAAGDSGTTNGKVPVTGGQIVYRWGWTNVTGGTTTTFAQALPVGVTWNAASIAAGCAVTGSYLTTGETLTCTITNLTDIAGTTDKTATVKNIANGTVLTSKLVSGSQQSSNVSLTAAGSSQVAAQIARGSATYMTDAKDPATGIVSGLQIPFSMAFYVPGTTADQIKGQESLGNNLGFSYTVTLPANAQLIGCGTDTTFQNDSTYSTMPSFGTGSSTATNRAANSGTMSCTQSGTSLTVTFSGVDGRLNQVPTSSVNYYPSKGIFALGGIKIWMPGTTFNSSSSTNVTLSASAASFSSISSISSATSLVSTSYGVQLPAFTLSQTSASAGSNAPYPKGNYNQSTQLSVPSGSGQSATNAQLCMVWDPTLQKIRSDITPLSISSTNITPAATVSNFTIEYGTATYADDTARRTTDCGSVGDNALNWFNSVANAGGSSEVSAVRIRYNRSLDPGQFITMNVAVTAPTEQGLLPTAGNPTGVTYLQYFNQRKSDQTALVKATTYSARTSLSNASVRSAVTFGSSDVKPGATTNVSIQPTVTTGTVGFADGRQALNVTETVTLPNGCYTFVPGSPAPISVTPSAPAIPSGAQTCADVAGQVIVWNLGNVTTGTVVPAITFALNANPSTPVPSVASISAVIASNSDKIASSSRTTTDTINVNTVNQFQVSLNASSTNVNTDIPVTYRAGWNNASSSDMAGTAYVVDVLPFVGDGRGTSGLGGLTVNSVTTTPSGLAVEYTTDDASGVMTALNSDQSGSTGITWTGTKPSSGITAIRVKTQTLTAWQSGYMDISVTPLSFAKGGHINNDLYAKADALTSGSVGVEDLTLNSSSSVIEGFLYKDTDYSGTKNTGDVAIEDVTVTLTGYNFGPNGINNLGSGDDIMVSTTTTTSNTGAYTFTVSPGIYSASAASTQVVNSTNSNLIVQPAANFEVSGAVTVSNKDFGYQEPISPPVAVNDGRTIYQGENVTINVLSNDTTYVPDGVPATTIGNLTTPARGTAVLNGNNTITYTANSVWPGSVPGLTYTSTFDYTLTNPQGSSTATVTVTVKRLPFGTTDVVAIKDGQTVDIDVLANDFGDTISFDDSASPTTSGAGTVSELAGKLHFVPATHAWTTNETSYTETLTYHIVDAANYTATGQANVTVYRAPVITNDTRTIAYNSTETISVLANDLVGRTPATVSLLSQPSTGSATVSGADVVFTPANGQTGTVSFTYRVTDGLGQINSGTITITVANDFNGANDGSIGTPIRTPQAGKLIDVLANDTGSSLSLVSTTSPAHGTAVISGGKIQYTPTGSYSGTDNFTYTVKDVLNTNKIVTVYLKVIALPTATNDTVWTDTATNLDIDVLANDSYDTSSVLTIVSSPSQGTVSVVDGKIHYVPPASGGVTTSFVYRITDDVNQTTTATVNLSVVGVFAATNDGSIGSPIAVGVVGKSIDVLANDTGSTLTITNPGSPAHGTTSVQSGKIYYTPSTGYTGADSFVYSVTDMVGTVKTATVYIKDFVTPSLTNDTVWTDIATNLDIDVLANDTYDAASTLTITAAPSQGTASVVSGKIHFVPTTTGTTSLTYRLTDPAGQQATATVSITTVTVFTAVNDGSSSSPIDVPAGGKNVSVLTNDTGSSLSVTATTAPSHGVITNNSGVIHYVPANGYDGVDTFTYTVTDQVGSTRTATVYLNVIAVPVLVADTATTDSDTSIEVNVRANDTVDASGVLALTSQPAHGTASIVSGKIMYVPEANYDGIVTIGYSLTDNQSQSATSTVTITITAAFLARDDGTVQSPLSLYPETKSVMVLDNDSGVGLAVTSTTVPQHGVIVISTDTKTITYTPVAGYLGDDSFEYTITDSHSQTSSAVVYLRVVAKPVVSAPVTETPAISSPKPTASLSTKTPTVTSPDEVAGESIETKPTQTNPTSTVGQSILLNDFDTYFDGGKKLALTNNQVIHFNIEKPKEVEKHTVTVARVGDKYVDVVIRSDPINARLVIGEVRQFDVNKDSHNDIEVSLVSIVDGQATMTFTQLQQVASTATSKVMSWQWWWLLVIVAVLATGYGIYKRRASSRKQ